MYGRGSDEEESVLDCMANRSGSVHLSALQRLSTRRSFVMDTFDDLHEEIATREAERDAAKDEIKSLRSAIQDALNALEHGENKVAIDTLEEALSPGDEE
jgi:predicted  nucleic acid-binding Zn-ribbon protein